MSEIKNLICRQVENIVFIKTAKHTNGDVWETACLPIRLSIIDSVLESAVQVQLQVKEDLDDV